MAGEKKRTIKSLSQEVDTLKEQIKEIPLLKQKLLELEKILSKLKLSEEITEEENLKMINCNHCDETFDQKKKLNKHLREIHPRKIKCKTCDKVFSENCELEVHIKTHHLENTEYRCNLCDKTFVLKWRLSKHLQYHSSETKKKCHYFNNEKICPYEDIGCMFDHEMSEICKFGEFCANKLCSYKHKNIQRGNEKPIKESNYECQSCHKILTTHELLVSHVETIHVEQEQIQRDYLFPQKCPNCPKWIYADSENESHYDDFEEFGQCEAQQRNSSSS